MDRDPCSHTAGRRVSRIRFHLGRLCSAATPAASGPPFRMTRPVSKRDGEQPCGTLVAQVQPLTPTREFPGPARFDPFPRDKMRSINGRSAQIPVIRRGPGERAITIRLPPFPIGPDAAAVRQERTFRKQTRIACRAGGDRVAACSRPHAATGGGRVTTGRNGRLPPHFLSMRRFPAEPSIMADQEQVAAEIDVHAEMLSALGQRLDLVLHGVGQRRQPNNALGVRRAL